MDAGRSGDDHVRDWAGLHRTEPPEGFVAGWLRAAGAVARPLARAGVSPNALTVAAMVAAVAAVPLALVRGWPGPALACVAVVVSGLLDALDGAVAVQAARATRVGFLLDSALDRLADAAFPATLAIVAGEGEWVAVAAGASAWWLEYVRARAGLAETAGASAAARPAGPRPTGPADRHLAAPTGPADPDAAGADLAAPTGPADPDAAGADPAGPHPADPDGSRADPADPHAAERPGGPPLRAEPQAEPVVERQVVTPGERPTRIILTAVGLGLPPLALAALWGHVVIVGGSAVFLLLHSLRRLRRHDAAPPAPTA